MLLSTTSSPNRYWRNSRSVKCCPSVNKFDRACLLMTRKNYFNVFLQKQLKVFSSLDGLYVDGTFKSAPKFFHQLFTIHELTMCNLHFPYRPINIQRPIRMYQTYGIRGCKSWCECYSNNCFCWLRNIHLQLGDNSVARLGSSILRLLCVGIFIQSFERQASGTVLRLPTRKLYWCRLCFFSAYLVRMYCILIEDHKGMWVIPCPLRCTILHCAS